MVSPRYYPEVFLFHLIVCSAHPSCSLLISLMLLQVTEGIDSTYAAVKSSITNASSRRTGRRRLPRPFTGDILSHPSPSTIAGGPFITFPTQATASFALSTCTRHWDRPCCTKPACLRLQHWSPQRCRGSGEGGAAERSMAPALCPPVLRSSPSGMMLMNSTL